MQNCSYAVSFFKTGANNGLFMRKKICSRFEENFEKMYMYISFLLVIIIILPTSYCKFLNRKIGEVGDDRCFFFNVI